MIDDEIVGDDNAGNARSLRFVVIVIDDDEEEFEFGTGTTTDEKNDNKPEEVEDNDMVGKDRYSTFESQSPRESVFVLDWFVSCRSYYRFNY